MGSLCIERRQTETERESERASEHEKQKRKKITGLLAFFISCSTVPFPYLIPWSSSCISLSLTSIASQCKLLLLALIYPKQQFSKSPMSPLSLYKHPGAYTDQTSSYHTEFSIQTNRHRLNQPTIFQSYKLLYGAYTENSSYHRDFHSALFKGIMISLFSLSIHPCMEQPISQFYT